MISITGGLQAMYNSNMREKTPLELEQDLSQAKCRIRDLLKSETEYKLENETLKELNVCVGCNNNPDYKTRIDKAIEYVEENITSFRKIELLKILQGDNNNE